MLTHRWAQSRSPDVKVLFVNVHLPEWPSGDEDHSWDERFRDISRVKGVLSLSVCDTVHGGALRIQRLPGEDWPKIQSETVAILSQHLATD